VIYLASPYTDVDPAVRERRFRCAETALFLLLRDRVWAYSPIVHCHELANRNKLPTTHDYWLEYDFDFLRRSDALYTLAIDGWDRSKGVAEERRAAYYLHIPRKLLSIDFHEFDAFYTLKDDNEPPANPA
jgi:uncharacterized protein DUF1937